MFLSCNTQNIFNFELSRKRIDHYRKIISEMQKCQSELHLQHPFFEAVDASSLLNLPKIAS